MNISHPVYGDIDVRPGHVGHPYNHGEPSHYHAPVAQSHLGSGRSDSNESLAGTITAGVESFHFDGRAVAGYLVSMDPAHQKRVGQIVFSLIEAWSRMPVDEWGPEHPMFPEWKRAQAAMRAITAQGI